MHHFTTVGDRNISTCNSIDNIDNIDNIRYSHFCEIAQKKKLRRIHSEALFKLNDYVNVGDNPLSTCLYPTE